MIKLNGFNKGIITLALVSMLPAAYAVADVMEYEIGENFTKEDFSQPSAKPTSNVVVSNALKEVPLREEIIKEDTFTIDSIERSLDVKSDVANEAPTPRNIPSPPSFITNKANKRQAVADDIRNDVNAARSVEEKQLSLPPSHVEPSQLYNNDNHPVDQLFDPRISAARAKQLSDLEFENELLLLRSQQAVLQQEIEINRIEALKRRNEVSGESEQKKWELEKEELQKIHAVQLDLLRQKQQRIEDEYKKKEAEADPFPQNVFLTQVYGLGQNLVARIVFDNNLVNKRVGDTLANGLRVEAIAIDGVWVSFKGDLRLIPKTTASYAYSQTLDAKVEAETAANSEPTQPSNPFGAPPSFLK